MKEFTPTYLYIKQHSITGLKYFGKTINNPLKYLGSGNYWLRHIKKHGKEHVITIWFKLFNNKEELINYSINFSLLNNIVESKDWANLMYENGINGGPVKNNYFKNFNKLPKSENIKRKISSSMIGNKNSNYTNSSFEERSLKISKSLKIYFQNLPSKTCPHCNLTSRYTGRFKSYHFDNCKSK